MKNHRRQQLIANAHKFSYAVMIAANARQQMTHVVIDDAFHRREGKFHLVLSLHVYQANQRHHAQTFCARLLNLLNHSMLTGNKEEHRYSLSYHAKLKILFARLATRPSRPGCRIVTANERNQSITRVDIVNGV